jgi:GT2 family glycosyltransferase
MIVLSVITVFYHSDDVKEDFLRSVDHLRSLLEEEVELLVRDNTSHNIGLSKAVNELIKKSHGDLILYVNPDMKLSSSVVNLINTTRSTGSPSVPTLVHHNVNRRYPTFTRIIFHHTWLGQVIRRLGLRWIDDDYTYSHEKPRYIEQPAAFVLMSRDHIEQITEGGNVLFYDERFPVFWNDVDLSMRARRAGLRFVHVPSCQVYHVGRHSTRTISHERIMMLAYSSYGMIGFASKWNMHPHILKLFFFLDAILGVIAALRRFFLGRRSRFRLDNLAKLVYRNTMAFRCSLR